MIGTEPAFLLGLIGLITELDNHLLLVVGVDGEVKEGRVGELIDVDGQGRCARLLYRIDGKLFGSLMNQRQPGVHRRLTG